jgi:hypothetical protein
LVLWLCVEKITKVAVCDPTQYCEDTAQECPIVAMPFGQ